MRDDTKTGFSAPWKPELGLSLIQVPLGQARSRPAFIDEDAVTLKVPAVPRQGWFPNVPRDVSAIIGSALLTTCLVFTFAPGPSVTPTEPLAERATEVETEALGDPPASDRGPVLAAVSPRLQPLDLDDRELGADLVGCEGSHRLAGDGEGAQEEGGQHGSVEAAPLGRGAVDPEPRAQGVPE